MTDRKNTATKPKHVTTTLEMAMGKEMAQAWIDLMQDGSQLMRERQQRIADLQAAIINARGPGDVISAQSAFAQESLEDCIMSSVWMSNALAHMLGQVQTPPTVLQQRSYDDVPL